MATPLDPVMEAIRQAARANDPHAAMSLVRGWDFSRMTSGVCFEFGIELQELGAYAASSKMLEIASDAEPDNAFFAINTATTLQNYCDNIGSLKFLDRVLANPDPTYHVAALRLKQFALLYTGSNYDAERALVTDTLVNQEIRPWLKLRPAMRAPTVDRLRVGYVFSLWSKPAYFDVLHPFLIQHTQDRIDVFCYHFGESVPAGLPADVRASPITWRLLSTDEAIAAEQIRADNLDIVVNCDAFHADVKTILFAHRPAPIQVLWYNIADSSRAPMVDAVILDNEFLSDADRGAWTETVFRLPRPSIAITPATDLPDPGPLPMLKNGWVTFGIFARPDKFTVQSAQIWRRVIDAVPGSQLYLSHGNHGTRDQVFRITELLDTAGIPATRFAFRSHLIGGKADFFSEYKKVDLVLDSFPFTGGQTTLDALSMSIPVVTYPGTSLPSRMASGLLSGSGWAELVAPDADGFVDLAVALASDPAWLADLRADIRPRFLASPMCDMSDFAREIGACYRHIYAWIAAKPDTRFEAP